MSRRCALHKPRRKASRCSTSAIVDEEALPNLRSQPLDGYRRNLIGQNHIVLGQTGLLRGYPDMGHDPPIGPRYRHREHQARWALVHHVHGNDESRSRSDLFMPDHEISDFADENRDAVIEANRLVACRNAGLFVLSALSNDVGATALVFHCVGDTGGVYGPEAQDRWSTPWSSKSTSRNGRRSRRSLFHGPIW